MYDKYIERIEQLNEQGQHMALQMLDDLLSNKKIERTLKVRDKDLLEKQTKCLH